MKYSADIVERRIEMLEEIKELRKIVEGAPIGQQLQMLEIVAEEILGWSSHHDFTLEGIVGDMVLSITKNIK